MKPHLTRAPITKSSKWAFWSSGLLTVLVSAVVTYSLHEAGLLRRVDFLNLDWWIAAKKPVKNADIFLLTITDSDYKNLFNATSPLCPETIVQIINLIAPSRPKAIGVDIDTSDWNIAVSRSIRNQRVPIVWALEPDVNSLSRSHFHITIPKRGRAGVWAVTGIYPDPDGLFRRYYRRVPAELPIGETFHGMAYLSFASAISSLSESQANKPEFQIDGSFRREEILRPINFSTAKFDGYSVSELLSTSSTAVKPHFPEMSGRIVLIGGSFKAARDNYPTLAGSMPGLEILAHSVVSEASEIREATGIDLFRADCIFGAASLFINYFLFTKLSSDFRKSFSLIAELVFLPLFSLLLSWLAFWIWSFYASFLILSVGLMIHAVFEFQFEQLKQIRELTDEVEALRESTKAS